jgi:hypothetical protein
LHAETFDQALRQRARRGDADLLAENGPDRNFENRPSRPEGAGPDGGESARAISCPHPGAC